MQSIQIIADTREQTAGVVESLKLMPGIEVTSGQLKSGDYQVNGWLFERKTLVDFAESIKDGRLFAQANRLAAHDQIAIILEGRAADLAQSQMRREAFQGALISLSLIYRIPILRSLDPAETARLLVFASQQLNRNESAVGVRHDRRPKRRRRLQLYLLQGLPGIGLQKAGRLLEKFGSVEAVMTASAEDLMTVDGIGPKLAQSIRWILERDRGID